MENEYTPDQFDAELEAIGEMVSIVIDPAFLEGFIRERLAHILAVAQTNKDLRARLVHFQESENKKAEEIIKQIGYIPEDEFSRGIEMVKATFGRTSGPLYKHCTIGRHQG